MFNRQGFRRMHRYIYAQVYGEQPDVVEHKCGNRICINPEHLFGMTKEEAIRQATPARQGRPPVHYCHTPTHALSPEQVKEAHCRLAQGTKIAEVARIMGLDRRTMTSLAAGETYREDDNG